MGKIIENVIEFAQNATNTKTFRNDYPISNELRQIMMGEVFSDFAKYSMEQYYDVYLPISKVFIGDHDLQQEKRESMEINLFWWRLFYDSTMNVANFVEEYIAEHYYSLKKRPILISWLREFTNAMPQFYQVEDNNDEGSVVLTDVLTEKTFNVMANDSQTIPMKQGEIIMGTLLPIGGSLFFPATAFYHFDFHANIAIAINVKYYYEMYSNISDIHEAFIHILSAVLQVEKILSLEN